ncbi:MAG TPA: DUF4389 domain-containing protein [Marmoricola sp.]|nr:DUF4389 domain-containing protein [Marmoricola sp.]
MSTHAYPVRVEASLEEPLSRWLWLVKWLLVIPHYVVLVFLWMAFVVLSVVAAFAILFTGRYPRGIFEFNVGVLRWTWRVGYYAYDALGTDRYPPFTLAERADYPAHLEVAWPEHLSRGLVLVKWWLLAIPHYLVVALFVGGGWYFGHTVNEHYPLAWQGGLIGILVLIAAVVLLFTGRYPRSIFDLVLGLNRWVLRVAAYAGLMTDDYPPFRLDTGGGDPAGPVLAVGRPPAPSPAPTHAPTAAPTQPPTQAPMTAPMTAPTTASTAGPAQALTAGPATPSWGTGRIIGVVVASVLVLVSLGLLTAGSVAKVADGASRDRAGYLMSRSTHYATSGYAVTSDPVEFGFGRWRTWPEQWLGTVKVSVDPARGASTFVGIAPTAAVDRYLGGVARTQLSSPGDWGHRHDITGGSPPAAPTDRSLWVASATGVGHQALTWKPRTGSWTLVVMNGAGTRGVAADVAVGATVPVLADVGTGLLVAGGVLLLGGAVLLTAVLVTRRT